MGSPDARLERDLEAEIDTVVDRHPELSRLPAVYKRNMARAAAAAILSE